tara:strand:+ start:223 stop:468 length:246 start_codon:yes stop_codon:yes gene_type:complete
MSKHKKSSPFDTLKKVSKATVEVGMADAVVVSTPVRMVQNTIVEGDVEGGFNKTRDDTFVSIDTANASSKDATGYKEPESE